MRCPRCGHNDTRVVDSRLIRDGNTIRRRRACEQCEGRYTTYEHAELQLPTVIKSDGRREPWDGDKILRGLRRACQKRPVSLEEQRAILTGIERDLAESLTAEVTSKQIGELVMEALHPVDGVAWVRFASVYLSFQDINEFIRAVEQHAEACVDTETTVEQEP